MTQVRNDLYHNFKIRTDELETLQAIKNLKKQLPVSKKHWQYNNKEVKHLQPDIDKITTSIVNRNNVHSYNQYMESIGYVANFYKEIYGENSNALNYIDNKNKELKQRLGNKLLKELKKVDYDKKRNNKITENIYRHSKKNDSFNNRLVAKTNKSIVTKGDLYKIDKAINDETKDYLNQIEYEKLQRKIEFENNH
ncbi:relaxase MobL [Staphylococcus epidermidis]|uniref:relaxase MobL n=1 Tax=Staphylococcus epidermidis TaxID=1282 RepID=UPI00066BAC99|nr:relaxase MobL [Staphylococcus epidermidis]